MSTRDIWRILRYDEVRQVGQCCDPPGTNTNLHDRELEDDLVPEWRVKYLDYKQGKKKIKAVARALKNANRTPRQGKQSPARATGDETPLPFTHYDFQHRGKRPGSEGEPLVPTDSNPQPDAPRPDITRQISKTMFMKSPPTFGDEGRSSSPSPVTQPLNIDRPLGRNTRYGSIIGSPPDDHKPRHLPSLELPDPALDPNRSKKNGGPDSIHDSSRKKQSKNPSHGSSDPYHVGPEHHPRKGINRTLFTSQRSKSYHQPPKANTVPKSKLKRMFSAANAKSPAISDMQLDAYKELDAKQDEFFNFLDKELDKIDSFYRMKEKEASHRLEELRTQLHIMRDQRVQEIQEAKHKGNAEGNGILANVLPETNLAIHGNGNGMAFMKPLEEAIRLQAPTRIGKTSKAMKKLASPDGPQPKTRNEDKSDYVRRQDKNEHVPYRFAKRRLKLAMQEFYRAMELLKSYTLLNRTGFRKINKKYDKAVNARPTGRYMTEKVNNAYFVQSNVIEGHLVAVEDLYSRYFERGNHKIAVTKLRSKRKTQGQSSSSFRNGLFVAAGVVLGIDGLVRGLSEQHIHHPDPVVGTQASYLIQIYAAYFLAVLLFLMFVVNCKIWAEARVNYVFVFEYDTRHVLDWRQLAELPCFFLFLNGLFLWLNFRQTPPDAVYVYWPVLLGGITLLVLIWPFPMLYHHARKWWGVSHWRLLCAGLYPVEFRDFYLGDMYCSETYAMSQFELFFCLYAHHWRDPPQCNSNHSHLLGFFTTIPAIWRALQCLRRYYDSRNWFPHLANFAKYLCNILYYMSLSLYRMNLTPQYRAVFITLAAVNGVYCSFWDVAMDFSLGNPYAEHPFLRDRLAYRRVWVYYAAVILDVILRQQWIFYAIFQHDLQHAAALSFFVGLAEVFRRGVWSLFRVENEHCNNVGKFRASRDIPLPYQVPGKPDDHSNAEEDSPTLQTASNPASSGVDVERAGQSPAGMGSSLRQRKSRTSPHPTPAIRAIQRVGTLISAAHAQDFEKRKKPAGSLDGGVGEDDEEREHHRKRDSSSDEEEEDGDQYDDDDDDGIVAAASEVGTEDDDDDERSNTIDVMNAQKMLSRGNG